MYWANGNNKVETVVWPYGNNIFAIIILCFALLTFPKGTTVPIADHIRGWRNSYICHNFDSKNITFMLTVKLLDHHCLKEKVLIWWSKKPWNLYALLQCLSPSHLKYFHKGILFFIWSIAQPERRLVMMNISVLDMVRFVLLCVTGWVVWLNYTCPSS